MGVRDWDQYDLECTGQLCCHACSKVCEECLKTEVESQSSEKRGIESMERTKNRAMEGFVTIWPSPLRDIKLHETSKTRSRSVQ